MAQAFGVGEVFKVEIVDRDPSGVAKTVQATFADGSTVTRSGNQLRNALGLKSSYINAINGSAGVPVAAPQAPGRQRTPRNRPSTTSARSRCSRRPKGR